MTKSKTPFYKIYLVQIFGWMISAFTLFILFVDKIRNIETRILYNFMSLFYKEEFSLVRKSIILVKYSNDRSNWFFATVTRSCSSATFILISTFLAFFVVRKNKFGAFLTALVYSCLLNIIRIALIFFSGIYFGRNGLIVFHDWFGSLITILIGALSSYIVLKYFSKEKIIKESHDA